MREIVIEFCNFMAMAPQCDLCLSASRQRMRGKWRKGKSKEARKGGGQRSKWKVTSRGHGNQILQEDGRAQPKKCLHHIQDLPTWPKKEGSDGSGGKKRKGGERKGKILDENIKQALNEAVSFPLRQATHL